MTDESVRLNIRGKSPIRTAYPYLHCCISARAASSPPPPASSRFEFEPPAVRLRTACRESGLRVPSRQPGAPQRGYRAHSLLRVSRRSQQSGAPQRRYRSFFCECPITRPEVSQFRSLGPLPLPSVPSLDQRLRRAPPTSLGRRLSSTSRLLVRNSSSSGALLSSPPKRRQCPELLQTPHRLRSLATQQPQDPRARGRPTTEHGDPWGAQRW